MQRYCAIFGQGSIAMLLADREFIGTDWFNWLENNDIPFTIRIAMNRLATRADGCRVKLATQITLPRRGRRCTATLDGMARPLHFPALKPKDGERVITATNRTGHDALATWCRRWAIETFGPLTRTGGVRGLTRQHQDPRPRTSKTPA